MFADARSLPPGTTHDCDVCIIGGGAAGISIANRLIGSELSIVLLEAGGFLPERQAQQLFSGITLGHSYYPLDSCRVRQFGGSTTRWGGWCRPLESVDFSRRDWLPWSGWPISESDLEPFYADTAKVLDIPAGDSELFSVSDSFQESLRARDSSFRSIAYQRSPRTNFGKKFRSRIASAKNVLSIIHSNVTEISLESGTNRVGHITARALSGPAITVRPRAVVLAAGGIENARILLSSSNDRPSGLGNEYDNVGRFFMEHLHVPSGHLAIKRGRQDGTDIRGRSNEGAKLLGFLAPTRAAQDKFQLLGASIALEPTSYSYGTPLIGVSSALTANAVNLYERLVDSPLGSLAELSRDYATRACHSITRYRTWSSARLARHHSQANDCIVRSLYFRSEQAPNRTNRVYLSRRRDALGMSKVILDWRPATADIRSISSWLDILSGDCRRMDIGELIYPEDGWHSKVTGGPHHMGTTRMSATPQTGVVDMNCRVHSVSNLFIAGASVFATGGFANPTFTVVALALRLADQLEKVLKH